MLEQLSLLDLTSDLTLTPDLTPVLASLTGIPVEEIPTSTSAMAELNKASPEQRPVVLQKAREANGGRPTAKAIREAQKPAKPDAVESEIVAGDYVSPKRQSHADEIGVVDRVRKTRDPLSADLEIKWLTHVGHSYEHSCGMNRRSPDDPLVVKALQTRDSDEFDYLTDQEKAELLGEEAPLVTDATSPFHVGDVVVDQYRPHSPQVIAKTSDTQACCWEHNSESWIAWDSLSAHEGPTTLSLESIARHRLKELVKVLGAEAVATLLAEVSQ